MEEADGIRRRKRSYLVATDLSDESVYALEWAIGTILRDGDTMVAVCAMHDENVTSPPLQTADGAKAASDSGSGVGPQTESTARNLQHDTSTTFPRYIRNILGQGSDNKSGHTDPKAITKAETDRIHTVESISETCVKLLRKTLLQVQITVEAIHCKNPKHMITDAVSFVSCNSTGGF